MNFLIHLPKTIIYSIMFGYVCAGHTIYGMYSMLGGFMAVFKVVVRQVWKKMF